MSCIWVSIGLKSKVIEILEIVTKVSFTFTVDRQNLSAQNLVILTGNFCVRVKSHELTVQKAAWFESSYTNDNGPFLTAKFC